MLSIAPGLSRTSRTPLRGPHSCRGPVVRGSRSGRCESAGFTVLELAVVLLLLSVGASALAGGARKLAHRASVVTAREEVIREIVRARAAGVLRGGASAVVVARPPSVRLQAEESVLRSVPLAGGEEGITVSLTGGRDSLVLRFDRLGIGRFANATVLLRRGGATSGLVVSSYGRVRRR